MNKLLLFNTLTRKKEEFKSLKAHYVGLYTCGPTVYDFAHIGNLRTYIFEDILKRTLQYNQYTVTHVMNITDVGHLVSDADEGEDKMMKALKREGLDATRDSLLKLAAKYTDAFKRDTTLLNILPPDRWTPATQHVDEMISLIKKIEKNGYTYEISDGLYFDTSKFKTYGEMANLQQTQLQAGVRVAVNEEKKHPSDFALWIKAVGDNKNHVMVWDSPWGIGFPGWHIECSAMSMKYLGNHFDIHCGGVDHIPVHHTNEIAQNEGAVGKQTVNLWMHGEFLNIDSARMGKSEGNFITLQTVIDKGIEPIAYRYLVLGTHYRQKLSFSWDSLNAAQNGLHNLLDATAALGKQTGRVAKKYQEQFITTINDDLNTPRALALAWEVLKDSTLTDADKRSALIDFDQIFGLGLETLESVVVPTDIKLMAEQRSMLRSEKKFSEADKIREEIEQRGFAVDDTADGFIIKKIRKS